LLGDDDASRERLELVDQLVVINDQVLRWAELSMERASFRSRTSPAATTAVLARSA